MTTTKKPTSKKTAVKNLHYGGDSGFPPRGRRTLGDPRRNPRRRRPLGRNVVGSVAEQRRRDMEARIRRQLEQRRPTEGRGGQQMTPAMRRRLMELRRRAQQRRQLPPQQPRDRQITPAMRRQMEAARRRFNQQRRRRRRPIGTPVPQQLQQIVPQQRIDRPAFPTQQVREVRQAIPEPMQRPRGRRMVAKGGVITKKNIGANDFRKGGYVLSTVDNRKNKK